MLIPTLTPSDTHIVLPKDLVFTIFAQLDSANDNGNELTL